MSVCPPLPYDCVIACVCICLGMQVLKCVHVSGEVCFSACKHLCVCVCVCHDGACVCMSVCECVQVCVCMCCHWMLFYRQLL